MRILYVSPNDISINDANTIRDVLSRFKHEIILEKLSAVNSIEQLDNKEIRNYDYIFVEFAVWKKIDKVFWKKVFNRFNCTPIIAMIDGESLKFIKEIIDLGVTDYITRPFTTEELVARFTMIKKNRKRMKALKNEQEELKLSLEDYGVASKALKKEIKLAKYVQTSVLGIPCEDEKIKIKARYLPSKELSGDMYCWFKIEEGRYGVILLDVMGHGISSALVGMSIRSLLKGMIIRLVDPVKVISELNNHMNNLFLANEEASTYYFSAIYLLIDTNKKVVEYVNAGHPPALAKTEKLFQLSEGSIAVGLMPNMNISKGVFSYEESLRILLYTDGILDFVGETPYEGIKNMENYFEKCSTLNCEEFLDSLIGEFNVPEDHDDDICLIDINVMI